MDTNFTALLESAVTEPGIISAAYTAFHNYSLGNMMLAYGQCQERNIPLGPLATFPGWKDKGRFVKKGEKALMLCMPVTVKTGEKTEAGEEERFTRFVFKNNWFVLAQTDGAELETPAPAGWEKTMALAALDITEIPFDLIDGNTLGYAKDRTVAINPVNTRPYATLFHELAHILLGHTAERQMADGERTTRDIREVEAEAVALLCSAALELPGADESRGYIQHWNRSGEPITEKMAQKIFKVADQIIKAGTKEAK